MLYLIGLLLVLLVAAQAQGECLEYEPASVALIGTVRLEVHAGPPNYSSIADGDRSETIVVLQLDAPICVNASSEADFERHDGVLQVQLVQGSTGLSGWVGRKVRVEGTLFEAHTGHHRYPVLMEASSKHAV